MLRITILLCIALLFISCGGNAPIDKEPIQRNVIVLLDLSDRIILNPNQINSDKQTILAILESYISSIKDTIIAFDKDFNLIKDKFTIRIADQKATNFNKTSYENDFQFDFGNNKSDNVKYILQDFQSNLSTKLDELYSVASKSKNPRDYQGADIWKFMNEDLEHLLTSTPNSKNYLFILTDGYLYFENYSGKVSNSNRRTDMKFMNDLRGNNWETKFDTEDYGLIPLNKKFRNLKVAVLEVNPKDYWNEYELLKRVWNKWLNEMDIQDNDILVLKSENLQVLKNKVGNFLK